jgi:hypothetical protein
MDRQSPDSLFGHSLFLPTVLLFILLFIIFIVEKWAIIFVGCTKFHSGA